MTAFKGIVCPSALVIRVGNSLAATEEYAYCDAKSTPFTTPYFSSASGLYVTLVAASGNATVTVVTGQVSAKAGCLAANVADYTHRHSVVVTIRSHVFLQARVGVSVRVVVRVVARMRVLVCTGVCWCCACVCSRACVL